MVVLADDSSLELPFTEDLIINIEDNLDKLLTLVDSLPNMFQNTKNTGSCLERALIIAKELIRNYGGKILVCQSNQGLINEVLNCEIEMLPCKPIKKHKFHSQLLPSIQPNLLPNWK